MKPIYTSLSLAIALLVFTPNQGIFAQAPANYTFSIHLGTFVKAQSSDFDDLRPLGFVYREKFRNNLQKIYLGEFSTEASANQLLTAVKAKGYPDAYVTRRNLQQGEKVYIIQLANKAEGEEINWQSYSNAGPLYAVLDRQRINILTGIFENEAEANQRLVIVQQLGYSSAAVAPVNNVYLHEISEFEAGGELIAPEVEFVVESPVVEEEPKVITVAESTPPPVEEVVAVAAAENTSATTEEVAAVPVVESTPPPAEMIPDSYDEVLVSRSPVAETPPVVEVPPVVEIPEIEAPKSNRIEEPYIRPKVKRTSAIELQKVLKAEGAYTGSLDGYYGRGTKGAYAKIMSGHPYINRYQKLNNQEEQWTTKGGIENDDLFGDWEALKLLHTIASDMDPNPTVSSSMQKEYASFREELYKTTKGLGPREQRAIIEWNTSLWKGLDAWTAKDPIHKKMTTPLKIAYYQSMVLLEDYYMNQKVKPLEAKGLALSVLQTLVAPYLESYRL